MRLPGSNVKVPSEEILADVIHPLLIMSHDSITEANKLIYATSTVILETRGYKFKIICRENPPWRRNLKTKIKSRRALVD